MVRRTIYVVRDFPPGCGPFAARPPVPPPVPSPAYPSGIMSPIPYHVHQAVDRAFIRDHSPTLAAHLDQIPIGPYQGILVPSPDIQARVRALTQTAIARARHVEPYASLVAKAVHYQHFVD